MRNRKPWRLLAILLAFTLVAAACGDDDSDSGGEASGSVVFGAEQELTGFNVSTSADNLFWGQQVVNGIWPSAYDVLPDFTVAPSELLAGPAEIVSEDPFTVRWTIVDEADWSDGTPISSEDFRFLWASCNGVVDEGEPVTDEGETAIDCVSTDGYELAEFTAVDDKTVELTFSEPYPDYEALFGGILPAHVAADFGENAWNEGFKDVPTVSGGPFQVDEWVRGQSLTLVPNPEYWGTQAQIAELTFLFVSDSATLPDALRNAEVDIIYPQPQVDLVAQVEGFDGVTSSVGFGPVFEHITFNLDTPALSNLEIRQAVALGIDRDALVEALMRPFSDTAQVLNNRIYNIPESPQYQNNAGDLEARDVERARELIESVGYTEGADGFYELDGERLSLRITTTGGNPRREAAQELMQAQLRDVGIELVVYNLPGGEAFSRMFPEPGEEKDFDIALFAWVGTPFPVPGISQIFGTGSGSNSGGYSNPEVDRLAAEAAVETDVDRRVEIVNEIDTLLWADLPSVPMYQLPTFVAHIDALQGVVDNATSAGITWNANEWRLQ